MTAKKPLHLIPALLLVASSLTIAACSQSDTDETAQTESSSMVDNASGQIEQGAQSVTALVEETTATVTDTDTDTATSAAESVETSASSAAQETAAVAATATKAVTDKAAAVAEKAAETKAAVTSKIAAIAPAGNNQTEMLELAKKSGCLSCHSIDKKVVGPAWRDVAAKYRGQGDAKSNIINSITNGSTGKWGTFAMPANSPRVSDENIATLAGFVLSLE